MARVYPKMMRPAPNIRAFRDWALAEAGWDGTQAAADAGSRSGDRLRAVVAGAQ